MKPAWCGTCCGPCTVIASSMIPEAGPSWSAQPVASGDSCNAACRTPANLQAALNTTKQEQIEHPLVHCLVSWPCGGVWQVDAAAHTSWQPSEEHLSQSGRQQLPQPSNLSRRSGYGMSAFVANHGQDSPSIQPHCPGGLLLLKLLSFLLSPGRLLLHAIVLESMRCSSSRQAAWKVQNIDTQACGMSCFIDSCVTHWTLAC